MKISLKVYICSSSSPLSRCCIRRCFIYLKYSTEVYTFRTLSSGTPPTITAQPNDATVNVGEAITLCVTATGTIPLTYEWYVNGGLIPNQNTDCYTVIEEADIEDDGTQAYVVISNAYGSVTSRTATITVNQISPNIIDEDFNIDAGNFSYADDLFRNTTQPDYASGTHITSDGYGGTGALEVDLGGLDNNSITNMSGGWEAQFTLDQASEVIVTLRYHMTQTSDYESDEYSDVLLSIDDVLHGSGTNDYIVRIIGNGNGGNPETTNWQNIELNCRSFEPGSHMIEIGGFNNKKTYNNESTEILVDDVIVTKSGN